MAITITAKLDTKGVTDGAKEVVDSVKDIGEQADKSNDKLEQVAKELFDQLGDLKNRTTALQGELSRMADSGSAGVGRVKSAARTAERSLISVSDRANIAASSMNQLGEESLSATEDFNSVLGEANDKVDELASNVDDLSSQIEEMGSVSTDSFGGVVDSAGDAAEAIGGAAGVDFKIVLESITAVSTGYLALADIAKKFIEVGKKAVNVVKSLADDGNPAAVALAESIEEVKSQLLEIAENPLFQEMFTDIADVINSEVIPAIRDIPGTVFEMTLAAQKHIMAFKEVLNLVPRGSTQMLMTMQDAARNAYQIAEGVGKKTREERKKQEEVAKVDEELAKIREAKNAESVKSALEHIQTEEELRDVIDDLTESIREEAHERNLTDEERAAAIGKIALAEERVNRLREENSTKEKQSAEESVKIAQDASKERVRVLQEEAENRDRLAREALEQERRNIEDRKRLVMGGDVKGAEKLLASQTREQVRDAYAEQQGTNAALRANYESGGDQKAVELARRRALGLARRQFDQGKANPEEVRAAQVELAGKAADSAVAQGKSSKETAQATKEAIAEMARTQNELEQVQAEMSNMRQIMGGISRQGERRRAQVAGSRQ